jgi:hypothetical protein
MHTKRGMRRKNSHMHTRGARKFALWEQAAEKNAQRQLKIGADNNVHFALLDAKKASVTKWIKRSAQQQRQVMRASKQKLSAGESALNSNYHTHTHSFSLKSEGVCGASPLSGWIQKFGRWPAADNGSAGERPWRRRRISILINYTWECVCISLLSVLKRIHFSERAAASHHKNEK